MDKFIRGICQIIVPLLCGAAYSPLLGNPSLRTVWGGTFLKVSSFLNQLTSQGQIWMTRPAGAQHLGIGEPTGAVPMEEANATGVNIVDMTTNVREAPTNLVFFVMNP
ncbi:hypothetical protein D9B87_09240 [Corynebacterium diphtheriae]|nr:hypothetical protein BJU21_04380 [Corynebacterium diphtheriae]OWM96315.1 hypothetical protein AY481_05905 [Corynebacterium diphtheriae bv. mitis]OSQ08026.1 hypothetical protein B1A59_06265 [Corynebacterium diphtheriae]RKW76337.1 hypothetical protein D9B42_09390 [Corynebacterium diphtheriae]RKW83710.1 hypothetical protein D9D07_09520 [Corynebacterium diphtheriae]